MLENKITITSQPNYLLQHLDQRGVAAMTFGVTTMYALFGKGSLFQEVSSDGIENMAELKGRAETKPFVITLNRFEIDKHMGQGLFSPRVLSETKDKIKKLFQIAPEAGSLGILTEGNERLRKRLIHPTDNTVGLMVPGQDKDYTYITNQLGELLPGTSSNPSGLERSRGSGNHRVAGLLADFHGKSRDLCILLAKNREPAGQSSSMLSISPDGEKVKIVRAGNIPVKTLIDMCHRVGIQDIDQANVKEIKPYDYSTLGSERSMGLLFQALLNKTLSQRGTVNYTPAEAEILLKYYSLSL